jgi:hypothetical protein
LTGLHATVTDPIGLYTLYAPHISRKYLPTPRLSRASPHEAATALRDRVSSRLPHAFLSTTPPAPLSPPSRARTTVACSPTTAQLMSPHRARPHPPNCCCCVHCGQRSSRASHAPYRWGSAAAHLGRHSRPPAAILLLPRDRTARSRCAVPTRLPASMLEAYVSDVLDVRCKSFRWVLQK